jgi:small conductance mechanosensitive channel
MDLVETLKTWINENGPDFLANLLLFLLILIVGGIVISIILKIARGSLKRAKKASEILENFAITVLHKVLWVVLLMMALPKLGVNVGPLIAGIGVGGFIIGFACQESLSNLAAGLMLILNHPFDIGHFIEAGGVSGVVKEMSVMATVIHTPDNKRVTIPNSKIWGTHIINYSALPTRRVDMVVGIGYDADIGKAISLVSDICKQQDIVLNDPAPTLEVVDLADSSVNLVIRPWCNNADYWNVFFLMKREIKEAFDREGIPIPFPQMDVHVQGKPKEA